MYAQDWKLVTESAERRCPPRLTIAESTEAVTLRIVLQNLLDSRGTQGVLVTLATLATAGKRPPRELGWNGRWEKAYLSDHGTSWCPSLV